MGKRRVQIALGSFEISKQKKIPLAGAFDLGRETVGDQSARDNRFQDIVNRNQGTSSKTDSSRKAVEGTRS